MDVSPQASDTVEMLKSKIHEQEGVATVQQRLIFGGKQLEDGRTVRSYKIHNVFDPAVALYIINSEASEASGPYTKSNRNNLRQNGYGSSCRKVKPLD